MLQYTVGDVLCLIIFELQWVRFQVCFDRQDMIGKYKSVQCCAF